MQESQNTIFPDHLDKLDEKFEYINYLLDEEQFDAACQALIDLHYADLADFLDNTNHKLYNIILPAIARKLRPETILFLNNSNQQAALEALGINTSVDLINQMDIEDAIEVIENIDQELKELLLPGLNKEKRQQILEGFTYPENTVGRVLERNFISLRNSWTVGEAINFIKKSNFKQDFYAAIVVDSKYQPVGNILLSTLLKSSTRTPLVELMNSEFKIAETSTELDELAFIFKQYALTIVPVVNKKGKLVGSISIANMLYIIEEQTENEFMSLGGVNSTDIFDNLYTKARHRFPWLFVNLLTACATSLVINQFSETIIQLITLATIMPVVASMGGNAGTQAMTVTLRALVNREIIQANIPRVILKETLVCLLNGIFLSLIGIILTYLLFQDINLSLVFAVAVIINFTIAGFLGSGTPIFLNYRNIDPVTASGVFLTACTDALGFFIFLGLAYFYLV